MLESQQEVLIKTGFFLQVPMRQQILYQDLILLPLS